MQDDDLIETEQIATRTFSGGAETARTEVSGGPALVFVRSGADGSVRAAPFALDEEATLVGRAPAGGGIKLPRDDAASRLHATLLLRDDEVVLSNESRNGTWVNGARADAPVTLKDRDVVRCGRSLFVYRAAFDAPPPDELDDDGGLVGASTEAARLRAELFTLGASQARVLLLGETGAGKEVSARLLHRASERAGELVAMNCASVPETLAESQLFGHAKGAFTGADREADGYFQQADGGTLFLDELGELPVALQPKLLRVLDDGAVTRVGQTRSTRVDARIVSATNRPLEDDVEAGRFRADLFARLAEITVRLPPLRDRREDVLLLLSHALAEPRSVELDLAEALLLHPWPFNVRELFKVARELEVRLPTGPLSLAPVAERLRREASGDDRPAGGATSSAPATAPASPVLSGEMPNREELEELLRQHAGNVVHVARATGRSRRAVYRWVEHHGVDLDAWRDS